MLVVEVSTDARTSTTVLFVKANDADSQSYGKVCHAHTHTPTSINFCSLQVAYVAGQGSTVKFRVEQETGAIVTRGTFENNDGETLTFMVSLALLMLII